MPNTPGDLILGRKSINEIIITTRRNKLSGGSGLEELSVMDEENINRLIEELERNLLRFYNNRYRGGDIDLKSNLLWQQTKLSS